MNNDLSNSVYFSLLGAVFCAIVTLCIDDRSKVNQGTDAPLSSSPGGTSDEVSPIIIEAAERNGISVGSNNWYIMLAIKKAENGRPGCAFGIMHPKAWDTNLDTQAGWCAATIVKNRVRWIEAGYPDDFITFLGSRYCPVGADNDPAGLNKNWIGNVKYWFGRLRNE